MGVEKNLKSLSVDEEDNKNLNPNVKEEEMEEGEIVGEEDDMTSSSSKKGVVEQPHPPEHFWTFWFDNPSAKSNQAIWVFIITYVTQASWLWELTFIEYKIEPKWEDPVCANGDKWTVTFHRGKSDTCWLYTVLFPIYLLALIGEQFEYSDEICGASVRARQDKIALWTKNAANETAQGFS